MHIFHRVALPLLAVTTLLLSASGCAQSRLAHEPGLVSAWDRAPLTAATPAPGLAVMLYTRHLMFGEPAE